jgi:hypothetical protein
MFETTFLVFFDNGHDFYNLEVNAYISENPELSNDDIVALTEEFESEARHTIGRGYCGECIGFQIADSVWDLQEEEGNVSYNEETCEMYVTNPDFKWLEISCGKDDIIKAFEAQEGKADDDE